MNPEQGQFVRVVFVNGTTAEGFVLSWSDEKSSLETDAKESILMIQNTARDVQMVKIDLKRLPNEELLRRQEEARAGIREQIRKRILERPADEPDPSPEDEVEISDDKPKASPIQTLVDLRKEAIRLEKEEYLNRAKSHEISPTNSLGHYAFPNFSKKPRPFQHSPEEDSGEDVRYYPGLSDLFGGEDKGNG